MKKTSTLLAILLFLICYNQLANAQSVTTYTFAATGGTYTALTGATTVTVTGTADEGYFNNIPIGFTFNFAGTNYTHAHANTNGFISLGTSSGNNTFSAAGGTANSFGALYRPPTIAALWDDMALNATNSISYQTSGTSPNRVLTIQYGSVRWQYNSSAAIAFQIKLYEGSNNIQFIYSQLAGSLLNASASIGIATANSTYLAINSSGTAPTPSSSTNTTTISAKPANGQTYTFSPPAPCSGTPNAGTAAISSASGIGGTAFNLSYSGVSTGPGISYQWQRSTDGGTTFTDWAGQTATPITGTSTQSTTQYRVRTTCSNGGGVNFSNVVTWTVTEWRMNSNEPTVFVPCGSNTNFFDSGGSGSDYAASQNRTYTFYPTSAGQKVRVVFSAFATESSTCAQDYDWMRIHNGNSTAAAAMHPPVVGLPAPCTIAGFRTGAAPMTLPMTFTSTAADGSLTFNFKSDGTPNGAGWSAVVSCFNPCTTPITTYNVTGGGAYCSSPGTGVTVGLSGSQSASVWYQLFRGATPVGSAVQGLAGGGPISFGNQTVAGNYTVQTTTTNGFCAVPMAGTTTNVNVSVTTLPVATFSYTGTPFCSNASNPSPTFSGGGSAGTFTAAPLGLSINAATGAVDLAASTAGTYTVTNTFAAAGGCPLVSHGTTNNLLINAAAVVTPGSAITGICQSASPSAITLSGASVTGGTTTGTWSITSLSPTNGVLNGALSNTGATTSPQTVTYTPPANYAGTITLTLTSADPDGVGPCTAVAQTRTVTIGAIPTAPVVGTITAPSCGSSTGSVALSGLPSGSWTLTRSPGGTTTIGSGTSTTVSGIPEANTYTYTITNASSCISTASGNVVIPASPVIPSIPTPAATYTCSSGSVSLSGGTLGANESFRWYNAPSAGLLVSSANPFVPSITTTTNYYVSRFNSVSTCESARVPVVASVSGLDIYTPTRTTGIVYTPLSGATSVSTWLNGTSTDNMSATLPIGFSFPFDGVNHTQFRVSLDGFITFNTATRANGGNLPSCNAAEPYSLDNSIFTVAGKAGTLQAIAPFYNDLEQSLNSLNTTISYLRTGTSPNQILTVQWVGVTEDYDNSNCSGTCVESNYNFQVRLYESSGNIEFIYGTMTRGDATGINDATYTVGINSSKLTASPNSSQLFTQQTANTATFISTASNGLTTIPTANSRITLTRTVPVAVNSIPVCTKNIYPLDGATNQCPNTSLSWEAVDGQPTGYDVYFSTSNPPLTLVSSNQTSNYYNPTLANGTTYFWRIVPRNSFGAAASTPVYSFSTSNGDNITGFTSTNGTISGNTVTLCQGQSTTIAIQGNLSAGSEYQWTSPFIIDIGCKNNPPYPLFSNCAAASRNFNSLGAGTYTYDVFTRGCNATSACQRIILNVVGTVTTPTAITFTPGTEPTCQLASAGTTTDYNSTATRGVLSWSLTGITNTVGTLLASAINSTTGVVTWPNGWAGSVTIRVESTGCNGPSTAVTRAVTVTANMTAGTASTTPSLCINTPLTAITHATTLATGIGAATNLPTGVTALFGSNTITISGTPSVSGTFNYSIPLTGGCGTVSATGTITVNAVPTSAGIARSPSGPQYTGTPISFTAVATPSGTYTYAWSSTPILAGVSTNPTSGTSNGTVTPFNTTVTNANAFNSNPGGTGSISYTVIATDANNCTVTGTQSPIIHPVVQNPQGTTSRCQGSGNDTYTTSTTMIVASPSTSPNGYTDFVWSISNAGLSTINSSTGVVTWDAGFSGTATISVYARNINATSTTGTQQSASQSTNVIVNALPNVTATNNGPYVTGQNIQLNSTPNGATTYAWSGPAGYNVVNTQNPLRNNALLTYDGVYSVTVTDANGCTGTDNTTVVVTTACTPGTWTGNANTLWENINNWSCLTVPNSTIDVTIPNVTNYPVINATINGSVKNITIASGATLGVNGTLTLNGNYTNNGASVTGVGLMTFAGGASQTIDGDFSIDELEINNSNGVSLVTGSDANVNSKLILTLGTLTTTNGNLVLKSNSTQTAYVDDFNDGTGATNANTGITGNITLERYIPTNTHPLSYHYIGGINGTSAGSLWNDDFSVTANAADGTNVTPTSTCDPTQLETGSAFGTLFSYNEADVTDCSQKGWEVRTTSAPTQKGQGFAARIPGNPVLDETGAYSNSLVTRSGLSVTNSNSNTGNAAGTRGNHLVANPFFAPINWSLVTGTNLDGTAYKFNGSGNAVPYNNLTGSNIFSTNEAFFIVPSNPNGSAITINFPATARRNSNNNELLRQQQPYAYALKVNVTADNNTSDNTLIAFDNTFTEQYDDAKDARKMMSDGGVPSIYTLDNSSERQCIMALPENTQSKSIPLSVRIQYDGNHAFTFDGVNDFPATAFIYLEDKQSNTWHNIRINNTYSFTATISDDADRFVLHFEPAMQITAQDAGCDNNNGSINLNQAGNTTWNYELTDANNNSVSSQSNFNGNQNISNLSGGVYTLTLNHSSGYTTNQTITINSATGITAQINATANTAQINEVISFEAISNGTQNNWDMGDGTIYTNQSQVSHSYSQTGNYTVTVSSSNAQCSAVVTYEVSVADITTSIANNATGSINVNAHNNALSIKQTLNKESQKATLNIYNALGQSVSNHSLQLAYNQANSISLNELANGVYFAHINSNGKTQITKFVVSR